MKVSAEEVSFCRSSSVGESTRLISAGSTVQVRPPAPVRAGCAGGSPAFPAPPALFQPMDLRTRVRHFAARHGLFELDTRVIVAVSGGSDSVALAHLVHELSGQGQCRVAGLVHFNHQLRATANDDEQFAASLGA